MKNILRKFIATNRWIISRLNKKFSFLKSNENYSEKLELIIKKFIFEFNPHTIIEFGGIDRPILTKNSHYCYIGVDIEEKENCYSIYDQFLVKSIEDNFSEEADLAISTTLLEHVKNNKRAVSTLYNVLNNGGFTAHYVPSKFHFYSIILRLAGPKLQKFLIKYLRPHALDVTGYPVFFDHCSCKKMQSLFKQAGFSDINLIPYYHATDYFSFFFPLYYFVLFFEKCAKFLNLKVFASGFIITAKKNTH